MPQAAVALHPAKNAAGRQDTYLKRQHRKSLIDQAPPDLAALLRGLSLIPTWWTRAPP